MLNEMLLVNVYILCLACLCWDGDVKRANDWHACIQYQSFWLELLVGDSKASPSLNRKAKLGRKLQSFSVFLLFRPCMVQHIKRETRVQDIATTTIVIIATKAFAIYGRKHIF